MLGAELVDAWMFGDRETESEDGAAKRMAGAVMVAAAIRRICGGGQP